MEGLAPAGSWRGEAGRYGKGWEKARLIKFAVEALRMVQAAERASYGLDAHLIDYDALTDAQLQSLIDGRVPR
jgi:hypothetical protein